MLPSMTHLLETRNLKRNKLGPADIYPQEQRQKEDELTSANVKQGFINKCEINNEHETAKDYTIDSSKVEKSFKNILTQKMLNNTFPSQGKRKAPLTKDNFWLVPVAKNNKQNQWIKELGSAKNLSQLAKRVPIFNKKEEVIQILADNNISILRSTWYIKMIAAYNTIQAEAKVKKKVQTIDSNPEWTQAIIKIKKELIVKLLEEYNNSPGTPTNGNTDEKYLHFVTRLAMHLYAEGMLDRHDFLTGIVEICEKLRPSDYIGMSFLLPIVMQYMQEMIKSQFLSRRLAFVVCRHLQYLLGDSPSSPRSGSPTMAPIHTDATSLNATMSPKPPVSVEPATSDTTQPQLPPDFPEHVECVVFGLVCIVQVITMKCPSANVWYPPDEPKQLSIGSPLDLLPSAPSNLPLPFIPEDDKDSLEEQRQLRVLLKEKEDEIVRRSYAVEMRWSSDKCQESVTGHTINRVLSALESLDKQNFNCANPLDSLYNKIFVHPYGKDSQDSPGVHVGEEAVIGLLCEWAISAKRLGEHRAALVAILLDRRQMHLEHDRSMENSAFNKSLSTDPVAMGDNSFNTSSNTGYAPASAHKPPLFQSLLFDFLDTQSPMLERPNDNEQLQSFRNLVQLFSELIQHDVFSYAQYINTLISRGDIVPGQISPSPIYSGNDVGSRKSTDHNSSFGPMSLKTHSDMMGKESEFEPHGGIRSLPDSKMGTSLFSPSEFMMSPDSRADRHFTDAVRSDVSSTHSKDRDAAMKANEVMWGYKQSRHLQYLMHFPIPFEDKNSVHESNQRLMLLYGAGRQRNEVKKEVKKVLKYLTKIIHNWTAMRDMDGPSDPDQPGSASKKKRHSNIGFPTTMLLKRFRVLSCFDQRYITFHASNAILNSYNNYERGNSNCLPNIGAITLVFGLIEESLDYNAMLQLATQLTGKLPTLEDAICKKHPPLVQAYTKEVALNTVAVMRQCQSYLTLNEEVTLQAFDAMLRFLMNGTFKSPAMCTTSEKCILMFLYDLHDLRVAKFSDNFSGLAKTIKQTLFQSNTPATSNLRYDPHFLEEQIRNPLAEPPLLVARREADHLREPTGTCRYSFVCSTIISICSGQQTPVSLNALATLCSEMNAQCTDLSSEWLGVLKALCCSSVNFNDVLISVNTSDASIRGPLSVFTAILIARNCLSLEDFIKHVAIPSLLADGLNNPRTSMGARLTCHLLLQLFKTPEHPSTVTTAPNNIAFQLMEAADRRFLAATQRSIAAGAVLAVLKAVLKLGDAGLRSGRVSGQSEVESSVTSFLAPIDGIGDFDDALGLETTGNRNPTSMSSLDNASLSDFAKHAVKIICSQHWVRERCLKDPEIYLLMDSVLTGEQRQNLIQLICWSEDDLNCASDWVHNRHSYIYGLLSNMTRWTLRQSSLELAIMLKQSSDDKSLPGDIAKAAIKVFQSQPSDGASDQGSAMGVDLDKNNMWLVAPLISKLPSQVQARVLKEASLILESSQHGSHGKLDEQQTSLLNQQPFLTLILTCLKNQDEQRDSLLDSLQAQILQIHTEWQSSRPQTQRDNVSKDVAISQAMVHEGLQLRLSLMGGMFDTIKTNTQWTSTVVVLLTQLIYSGVVDVKVNPDLFWTVYDMVAVLLHDTLNPGDSRKEYLNIVRKIKKEIGDHKSESLTILRRLLLLPRKESHVIVCETIPGTERSLRVSTKQKIVPWEIIEGLKTPAPLCLSWFSAARTERTELLYEHQHQLMMHHDHSKFTVDAESYWKPPELAPEEIEDEPTPNVQKRKRDNSSFGPLSPSGHLPSKKRPERKKRTKSTRQHSEVMTPSRMQPNNVTSYFASQPYQNAQSGPPPYPVQSYPVRPTQPMMGYHNTYQESSDVKQMLRQGILNRNQAPPQQHMPQQPMQHMIPGIQEPTRVHLRDSIMDRTNRNTDNNRRFTIGRQQSQVGVAPMHHGNQPGYNFTGQQHPQMQNSNMMQNQGYNSYGGNHQGGYQRGNPGAGMMTQQSYMGQDGMQGNGGNYQGMVMPNNMMGGMPNQQPSGQYGMMQPQQMQQRGLGRMNSQQGMGGQGSMMGMHGQGGGGMNTMGRQMSRQMPQSYGHMPQQQGGGFVQNIHRGNMNYNQQPY